MAWPLLAGIAGLALLDSLNPATIAAVALVLLLAQHRPVLSAVAVAAGAYLTVLGVGLVFFFSAGAVADAVNGVVVGLRFVAFGAAGISLIATGFDGSGTGPESGYTCLTGSHQRSPSGWGLA